jgi:hypothetical protein
LVEVLAEADGEASVADSPVALEVIVYVQTVDIESRIN